MVKKHNYDEEHVEVNQSDVPTVEDMQDEIERLKVELDEERKHVAEEHDRHLRALADFSNYRRRHQDDYNQAAQFASQELILKILPAIDNFERALEATEQNHSYESLLEGVKLTLRQLHDIIEKEGVQPIKSVGEQFDPSMHEAVMRVETDDYPENTIVEELQPGYVQNDKIIRPARVKVAVSPIDVEG